MLSNGKTVIQNTVASPIVDSTATYTQGGVDAGTTQYIDAFQRANFWGTVQTSSNYHLLLGTPCGILEAGDPLENNPNFGAYPYFVSSRSRARC